MSTPRRLRVVSAAAVAVVAGVEEMGVAPGAEEAAAALPLCPLRQEVVVWWELSRRRLRRAGALGAAAVVAAVRARSVADRYVPDAVTVCLTLDKRLRGVPGGERSRGRGPRRGGGAPPPAQG